jgi:fatty-acyl-CoA synthase
MQSTMQDAPLLISGIVRHGESVYAHKKIFTVTHEGVNEATFFEVSKRAEQLAAALTKLGVQTDDRVGTFMWNNQTHVEAYIAVPCMGAILHTLNIRLFPEQLAFIINHAQDKVIIIDSTLAPLLAKVRDQIPTVEHIIVSGPETSGLLGETIDYETFIGAEQPGFVWPQLDEHSAAILCYTSGTTGDPKGVMYSHRSMWLHSMASTTSNSIGFSERDRVLLIVPMFHVNAWGAVFTAFFCGAELIMPQMFLQGEPIIKMIAELRATFSLGVPTIWNDVLRAAEGNPELDFSSLRGLLAGGSAVPRVMIETFRDKYGIDLIQGWGMTESSPLAAVSIPPAGTPKDAEIDYRVKAGRVVCGVEIRITDDDGNVLPRDGQTVGEYEMRGPWITGSYFLVDDPDKFRDGWLRTGDIGTLDELGFLVISDRTKDVIKSGGEWISSVALESTMMAHPAVFEAAVVAVPDEKWQERPLCCVVLRPDMKATPEELRDFLSERVAKWWVPENWTFVEVIPKTSVGKFDKKVLRAQYHDGSLNVVVLH